MNIREYIINSLKVFSRKFQGNSILWSRKSKEILTQISGISKFNSGSTELPNQNATPFCFAEKHYSDFEYMLTSLMHTRRVIQLISFQGAVVSKAFSLHGE